MLPAVLVTSVLILLSPWQSLASTPLSQPADACDFGILPGTWITNNQPGARWQLLSPTCQTDNILEIYRSNTSHKPARILALSDSVDRYLLKFTCEHVGGRYVSSGSHMALQVDKTNQTTYFLQICESETGLKLASTYLPGVHPTGPYHRGLLESFYGRIDFAKQEWDAYSSEPPDVLIVAANFWDLARLYSHEPEQVSGEELSAQLLETWMANYTAQIDYSRKSFPKAGRLVFRTTLPPKHDTLTGLADKPYLGRRYYVEQLNAAGREVARRMGLQVVDYEAVGSRFIDSFQYLHDLLHPAQPICLELGNIFLNIALSEHTQNTTAPTADQTVTSNIPLLMGSQSLLAEAGCVWWQALVLLLGMALLLAVVLVPRFYLSKL